MKFIISNKVYDTEKSTLICSYEEQAEGEKDKMDFFSTRLQPFVQIYVTPKKLMFLVRKNPNGTYFAKKLEESEAGELLDKHTNYIDYEAYTGIFDVGEA